MTMRDGQPSLRQARMMAKVFIIATLVGGAAVFLNVTMRSYSIRMQQAEIKSRKAGENPTSSGKNSPADQKFAAPQQLLPLTNPTSELPKNP